MAIDYDQIQMSEDSADVVYLYEFAYGVGATDRYCTKPDRMYVLGSNWEPSTLTHGSITASGSLDKQTLDLTAAVGLPVVQLFTISPPSFVVVLTIYRGHFEQGEYVKHWSGEVKSVEYKGASEATLRCDPTSATLGQKLMRRKYQIGCPHVLYGKEGCRAQQEVHSESGVVLQALNPVQVVVRLEGPVRGVEADNLAGGVIRIELPDGTTLSRTITECEAHPSREFTINLMSYAVGVTTGLRVSVSKGCDHTFATCRDRFNNTVNFGGCPNIPTTDPYRNNSF